VIALGIPFWAPEGGENHPDAVVTKQSVWLDGEQIVADGNIVGPPDLRAMADELLPAYA
jgi:hypothetical protein